MARPEPTPTAAEQPRLPGPVEGELPAEPPEPPRELALELGQPASIVLPAPDGRFRVIMPGAGYALQVDSAAPVYFPFEQGDRPVQIRPREDLRVKGIVQVIAGQPGQAVGLLAKRRGE